MPGTRHAKNNTALGYFTRAERDKLGWGSQKKRLAKESIKQFYACTICLKLCINPLLCTNGDLFCKECIYQSLLRQKRKNKEKLNDYNKQQQSNQQKIQQQERKKTVDKFLQFDCLQNTTIKNPKNENEKKSKSILTAPNPHNKNLACFWIPSLAPNAGPVNVKSPDMNTYCPGCNKPLKRKQLIPVRFTLCTDDKDNKNKKEDNLFECGSCAKILTNAIRSVCLRKCGHVICLQCVKKFVSKNKCCLVCDEPCKKKHVVVLSSGGTGFAAHGNKIEAVKRSVAFQ